VDAVRFGRQVRALRRRRGWRQRDLATASRSSQPVISRLESGDVDALSVRAVAAVADALGAAFDLRLQWHGEALDRLLDAAHAAAVEAMARRLIKWGWDVQTEVTFAIYGERGSVDILARHQTAGVLLVVEVKSVVPDVQATLAAHDRKVRLAHRIAAERLWGAGPVAKLLVIVDARTARRRVADHGARFGTAYPAPLTLIRRWLRHPTREAIAGLMFVPDMRHADARHRNRARGRRGRA
jgi:transcriptional regulator with XRE-family HTH domain